MKGANAVKSKPPIKQKYIKTPEALWNFFLQYVEHERNNPMYRTDYVGKDGNRVDTALQVPITFEGFECWLADQEVISDLGHIASNRDGKYQSYVTITSRIRQNCFTQNFKGAAVGLFNANLIARKLGISDKQDNTIANPDGSPMSVTLKI